MMVGVSVGGELDVAIRFEPIDSIDQTNGAHLDQILQRLASIGELSGQVAHQVAVHQDELVPDLLLAVRIRRGAQFTEEFARVLSFPLLGWSLRLNARHASSPETYFGHAHTDNGSSSFTSTSSISTSMSRRLIGSSGGVGVPLPWVDSSARDPAPRWRSDAGRSRSEW